MEQILFSLGLVFLWRIMDMESLSLPTPLPSHGCTMPQQTIASLILLQLQSRWSFFLLFWVSNSVVYFTNYIRVINTQHKRQAMITFLTPNMEGYLCQTHIFTQSNTHTHSNTPSNTPSNKDTHHHHHHQTNIIKQTITPSHTHPTITITQSMKEALLKSHLLTALDKRHR
eukprot:m.20930 g.20930  ORF g.20930 m.20930 type:complete len:171 (+) comp5301_c0_seq1:1490-2002(+)